MAIKGSFYPTSGTDRPFYYSDFNANFKDVFTNGIATRGAALTTQMEVSAVSATMKSQVDLGIAYVNGIRSEIYTAAEEVTHDAADASNPRYDIVCLEVYPDPAGGVRNSRCVIVKGTAAGSPVVPDASLVQTDNQYQYPLCNVLVPAGETDADNFTYTDRRALTYAPIPLDADNVDVDDSGGYFSGSDVEAVLQEIGAPGHVVGTRFARTTTQSIPANSETAIEWDSYVYNPDSSHDGSHASRMICKYDGVYTIMITAELSQIQAGKYYILKLYKNGTTKLGQADFTNLSESSIGGMCLNAVADCIELEVDDYIEAKVRHNNSSAINITITPFLSMRRNRF
ncbi:MAG: hypothetical protein PHO15_02240 [Eubacteriales bacterium]|nr:hypothetical protein [Eubacteriales bacterium]